MCISDWSSDVCSSVLWSRSYEPLTKADLKRLGEIAADDRAYLFRRKPETAHLYGDRLFAVALCQGGALHYLDGKNGIKDLDVWSFFKPNPKRQFPYRRRAELDFGNPKFGQSADTPAFVGQIGRAHACTPVHNAHLVCRPI